MPLRGTSILRLRRAPSPRGYSYHMQYRTFISHPARYVAYESGKDLSTSLPLTIRSSALHSWHTDRCVEGGPLRGTFILRLRRAPSPRGCSYHMQYRTFISHPARYVAYERGKDLSTSLPLTIRSSALHSCHTDRCRGLLIWHAIPRAALISKLATLQFYDAPRQNLEPINLSPYAFTASHAMSER